jgi:hypothetical protein
MQAAALCVVTLCSYAILGRIGHTTPWSWEVVAAAITTVLLFFQVRLVEDIDIHACGGELIANLGRRRELPRHPSGRVVLADGRLVPKPSTLLGALAFTMAIVVLLNAWIGRWALIAALVTTPLTFSFASRVYATVFSDLLRTLGASRRSLEEFEPKYQPVGIALPTQCPRGGFRFAATLFFTDGTEATSRTSIRCPTQSRRLRRAREHTQLLETR